MLQRPLVLASAAKRWQYLNLMALWVNNRLDDMRPYSFACFTQLRKAIATELEYHRKRTLGMRQLPPR